MASDWHAGHMAHAATTIKRLARYLTAVVEVVDARAPLLTRYPGLRKWIGACPVLVVMTRDDLADPIITARWLQYFHRNEQAALALTATQQGAARRVVTALEGLYRPGTKRRAAVIGLPNLGKSTLLNQILGRHRLRTGNRPGVTRGPQWIKQGEWEWLDLPGVMSKSQTRDWRLQAIGAAASDVLAQEALAQELLRLSPFDVPDTLEAWARRHGMLKAGGAVDETRAAAHILTSFQSGRLGRISLEQPDA
jgi:ribosome biogenesis GTPase A